MQLWAEGVFSLLLSFKKKIEIFLGKDKNMWVLFPQFISFESLIIFPASFIPVFHHLSFHSQQGPVYLNTRRPSHNFLPLMIIVAQTPMWNICYNLFNSVHTYMGGFGEGEEKANILRTILYFV